jgi:hypothetical protein
MLRVMAKRRVDLMLEPLLVERVDAAAARLRWSRTTFVAAALEGAVRDPSFGREAFEWGPGFEEASGDGREAVAASRPSPGSSPSASPQASELEEAPVPNPPASPRAPEFSPAPDFGPLVRRGSDVLGPEPNVDRFERTDDYRRAMALYRERQPWEQLMKGGRDG